MRRRVLTMLAALALVLAAASVAAVVYVAGRMLSSLLGFILLVWSITA